MPSITFFRLPQVLARRGIKRAKHYQDITRGLYTRPVRIGARAVAWPEHEVDELAAAALRGLSDGDIRVLVGRLEAARLDLIPQAAA